MQVYRHKLIALLTALLLFTACSAAGTPELADDTDLSVNKVTSPISEETVLAILTLVTAVADLRLAEKYSDTVTRRYALETAGQEFFASLSGESGGAVI